MAIQTPFHMEGFGFPHEGHSVNPTVTGFATDAFVDVNAVVEIDEIRNIVYPRPLDRPILTKACPYGLERRTVRPHLLVTIHADLCWRNSGECGLFD